LPFVGNDGKGVADIAQIAHGHFLLVQAVQDRLHAPHGFLRQAGQRVNHLACFFDLLVYIFGYPDFPLPTAVPHRSGHFILGHIPPLSRLKNNVYLFPCMNLDEFSTEELEQLLAEAEVHRGRLQRDLAFARFTPFPYQEEWYRACFEKTHPIVALFCGNQLGKSTLGALVTVARCMGIWPESISGLQVPFEWRPGSCRGQRFLAAGETFEVSLRDTIVPKLQEFVTPDMLERPPKRNSLGIPTHWRFVTGAELVLMSYQQATESYEGAVWDGVWFDEPPPQDAFSAIRRGCLARKAQILITATPLKEAWMLDDLLLPSLEPSHASFGSVAHFEASIWENAESNGGVLPDAEIESFLSSLPPKERQAREFGHFADLQGLEFEYVRPETHVVPDFDVPPHWPVVEVVDPSMKRGLTTIWATVDPEDFWYVIQAKVIPDDSFSAMNRDLQKWRDVLGRQPDYFLMDQRGGAAITSKEKKQTWFDEFRVAGTTYQPSREVPMQTLHGWLKLEWMPRKEKFLPKLRLTQRVANEKDGPLHALQRFVWDERLMSKGRLQRQKSKDFVDCLRYLAGQPGMRFQRLSQKRNGAGLQGARIAQSYSQNPSRKILVPGLRRRQPAYRTR